MSMAGRCSTPWVQRAGDRRSRSRWGAVDQAAQIDLYAQGAWLFDADFYFANNRDLTLERLQKARFASALDHYPAIGDREGRSASLFFDSRFYLAQLPSPEAREAAAEGAFHHYLRTRGKADPNAARLPLSTRISINRSMAERRCMGRCITT